MLPLTIAAALPLHQTKADIQPWLGLWVATMGCNTLQLATPLDSFDIFQLLECQLVFLKCGQHPLTSMFAQA